MTGDESKFVFLTRRKGGYVTFRDNGKGRIIRHGSIGRKSVDDDLALDFSMGRLQIEDGDHQQDSIDSRKEERSPLAFPPPP